MYDIAWGGMNVFSSVSADGSVRVFDLRQVAPRPQTFELVANKKFVLDQPPKGLCLKSHSCNNVVPSKLN